MTIVDVVASLHAPRPLCIACIVCNAGIARIARIACNDRNDCNDEETSNDSKRHSLIRSRSRFPDLHAVDSGPSRPCGFRWQPRQTTSYPHDLAHRRLCRSGQDPPPHRTIEIRQNGPSVPPLRFFRCHPGDMQTPSATIRGTDGQPISLGHLCTPRTLSVSFHLKSHTG